MRIGILLFEGAEELDWAGGSTAPTSRRGAGPAPAPVDWAALARASGITHVETVDEPASLAPALDRARRSGGPAVLMLPIAFDPTERIPPYSERPEEIRTRFPVGVRS